MVRIRGRIGDWPVDLTLELETQEWKALASATETPVAPVPAVPEATRSQSKVDTQWQAVLELLRRAGRIEGPQLLLQLSALAGGEAAGKRLLVRLRHCEQVRLETASQAPVYCWLEQTDASATTPLV
jgi:hypothetical protein